MIQNANAHMSIMFPQAKYKLKRTYSFVLTWAFFCMYWIINLLLFGVHVLKPILLCFFFNTAIKWWEHCLTCVAKSLIIVCICWTNIMLTEFRGYHKISPIVSRIIGICLFAYLLILSCYHVQSFKLALYKRHEIFLRAPTKR